MIRTWGDVYNEFKKSTNIPDDMIIDHRPASPVYLSDVFINDWREARFSTPAIIVWLKDGSSLIYVSKKGSD